MEELTDMRGIALKTLISMFLMGGVAYAQVEMHTPLVTDPPSNVGGYFSYHNSTDHKFKHCQNGELHAQGDQDWADIQNMPPDIADGDGNDKL